MGSFNRACETLEEVPLRGEELARYARHLTLPQVGLEGQLRLRKASVLCIGAGGLGSPVTLYLAAAGVGRLGIVDPDHVDASNLQRQILHGTSDVGRPKTESAIETLKEINPYVTVEPFAMTFTSENAREIAAGFDIVIDGTDNFPTRYLSNDVAFFLGKPNIYGSIYQFEGQVSVFAPHTGGPCYRCMFPTPPEPGMVPSCAEGGVFGVLPGIVGSLQASEAIKMILGVGEPLTGRLVHFDALQMRFREFRLRKDPQCPLCGDHPSISELIDYEEFCGVPRASGDEEDAHEAGPAAVKEIGPAELGARLENGQVTLVDVREDFECAICGIPGAVHIPLRDLPERADEIPKDKPVVFHCKSGYRSQEAASYLAGGGFPDVYNLRGGIDAWAADVDPSMPRY